MEIHWPGKITEDALQLIQKQCGTASVVCYEETTATAFVDRIRAYPDAVVFSRKPDFRAAAANEGLIYGWADSSTLGITNRMSAQLASKA